MRVSVGQAGWRETAAVKMGSQDVSDAWLGEARLHPTGGPAPIPVSRLCFLYPTAGSLNARMLTWHNENGGNKPAFAEQYWSGATFFLPQLVEGALTWKQAAAYTIEGGLVKVPIAGLALEVDALDAAIAAGHLPFLGITYTYLSKVVKNGEGGYVNAPLLWQKTPTYNTACEIMCKEEGKRERQGYLHFPKLYSGLCVQDANGFVVAQCAAKREADTWGDAFRVFSADGELDEMEGCAKYGTDVSNQAAWSIGFNILGSPYGGASLFMTGYTARLGDGEPQMPYGSTYLEYSHAE